MVKYCRSDMKGNGGGKTVAIGFVGQIKQGVHLRSVY